MRCWIVLLLTATAVVACSDTTGFRYGNVAVSFSTRDPAAGATAPDAWAAPARDDTITSGADTIIVTSAQLVLREVELERADAGACDVEPNPAGCEEVELGPFLVDLPLVPGAEQQFSAQIPPGTYVEIEFEVHKVSGDDPADVQFLQQHPEFADRSIRVAGAFNGAPFVFESDLNVTQELALVPALVVQDMASTNVTVRVDLDAWFRTVGGTLVDPSTANKGEPNENLVRDNIIASMLAFEDPDGDGSDN